MLQEGSEIRTGAEVANLNVFFRHLHVRSAMLVCVGEVDFPFLIDRATQRARN